MSAPKVGCHATIREGAIPRYTGHYGPLRAGDTYIVRAIDNGYGRGAIHLEPKDGGRTVMVWRDDVEAAPRCKYCDQEGHTGRQATRANCAALRANGGTL